MSVTHPSEPAHAAAAAAGRAQRGRARWWRWARWMRVALSDESRLVRLTRSHLPVEMIAHPRPREERAGIDPPSNGQAGSIGGGDAAFIQV